MLIRFVNSNCPPRGPRGSRAGTFSSRRPAPRPGSSPASFPAQGPSVGRGLLAPLQTKRVVGTPIGDRGVGGGSCMKTKTSLPLWLSPSCVGFVSSFICRSSFQYLFCWLLENILSCLHFLLFFVFFLSNVYLMFYFLFDRPYHARMATHFIFLIG